MHKRAPRGALFIFNELILDEQWRGAEAAA